MEHTDLDLERARALLRLSERIAEHERSNSAGSASPASVQDLFYRHCRKAELAEVGAEAAADLREENRRLADTHGFDVVRRQAERQAATTASPWIASDTPRSETAPAPDAFPPAERGTPVYWAATLPIDPPRVTLAAAATRPAAWGTRLLTIYLALLAGAVLLSFFPRLAHAARAFWPEQMLVLGVAGWALLGPTWMFVFLILAGVLGRLVHLAGWLGSLRPKPVVSGPGSTVIKPASLL